MRAGLVPLLTPHTFEAPPPMFLCMRPPELSESSSHVDIASAKLAQSNGGVSTERRVSEAKFRKCRSARPSDASLVVVRG